jgi:long-chain acyl-CoA synthetase
VHYLPRFSPVAVVRTIAEKRVSVFITVASMFGALAAMKDAAPPSFASLTLAVSGGEPLPAKAAASFEERCGTRIYEGYGMTEASPVVTLNTPWAYRAGSVGRPLPGISVQAVDVEGHALSSGQDGELVVRGHCVMRGYLNRPALTTETIRDGGLHTGDIGQVDADGFVYITGRAKEMLIVGGENVFPREIETVLVAHPAVTEAAVVGVRDDIRGELPIAYVIRNPTAPAVDEAELRGFCRQRLAAYKVPRRVYIAEELPRGPTGKILKRALKDHLR